MRTERERQVGARWLMLILAVSLGVVAAIFTGAALAQSPQDFKVCSDTSCVQIIVTPVAPPCPVKPADESRAATCPSGTTGSWTQTQTYSAAPAPQCWVASGYLPISPPAGSCVATPPPTPGAPSNLAATFAQNTAHPANTNITLIWSAVAACIEYEVHRCVGANCTNFAFLQGGDTAVPTYTVLDQPPNSTQKYKTRCWKPAIGPYSAVLTLTTPTNPPPTGTGTATLDWTHDGKNTNGTAASLVSFRILYGASATQLTESVVVPNAAARTFIVDKLTPGTWFFAVRAFDGVSESVSSNVDSKVVP